MRSTRRSRATPPTRDQSPDRDRGQFQRERGDTPMRGVAAYSSRTARVPDGWPRLITPEVGGTARLSATKGRALTGCWRRAQGQPGTHEWRRRCSVNHDMESSDAPVRRPPRSATMPGARKCGVIVGTTAVLGRRKPSSGTERGPAGVHRPSGACAVPASPPGASRWRSVDGQRRGLAPGRARSPPASHAAGRHQPHTPRSAVRAVPSPSCRSRLGRPVLRAIA